MVFINSSSTNLYSFYYIYVYIYKSFFKDEMPFLMDDNLNQSYIVVDKNKKKILQNHTYTCKK